jgi:hypothetical protein
MRPGELLGALQQAAGIIAALAGLVGSAAAGYGWLAPNLVGMVGEPLALLLGTGLPFAATLALVLWVWRRTRSVSRLKRPEVFDLKASRPEDLVGRERDVRDLKALVEERALVFLVGKSGAGKSAFVAAGLLPALRRQGRLLPVLVSRYGTDWSNGPAQETVQTLGVW